MGASVEVPKNGSSLAVFMWFLSGESSGEANRGNGNGGNRKTHLSLISGALFKSSPQPILIRLF